MRIALIPCNSSVGAFDENLKLHKKLVAQAVSRGADLIVFPELSLLGYPPKDLLFRRSFLHEAEACSADFLQWLRDNHPQQAVVFGTVKREGSFLLNCAVFAHEQEAAIRGKTLIPGYDIFQENRYFTPAASVSPEFTKPILWKDQKVGLLICEDSWNQMQWQGNRQYQTNPTEHLVAQGATLLINLSASPFEAGKKQVRRELIAAHSKKCQVPIFYVSRSGAQDEVIFDGDSFCMAPEGHLVDENEPFQGNMAIVRFPFEKQTQPRQLSKIEEIHKALVIGIRDYASKNGFQQFVLGLSGGIDSAVVAALAAEAFGPSQVTGLLMPSKFSSLHSIEDAHQLAMNLGIRSVHMPIKMVHSTAMMSLKDSFAGKPEDATEENLQARIRGLFIMANSNKFGALALATGNKSEFAMGYSTLYGDMCGGLAPIGDLYKTEVYELAAHLNSTREVIPQSTLEKPPSAELRPNQTDQDSLPPYEKLDFILRALVEGEMDVREFEREQPDFARLNPGMAAKISSILHRTEFKRKQAPPILKLSSRCFGAGRNYPLTYKV